jgi:hypothetical protein
MVTQSLRVNNVILYFPVCNSYRVKNPSCHDRKQVCIQYTDQTHTVMINHTGQQNIHTNCTHSDTETKQKGKRTCVRKAYSSNLHFSKTFLTINQGTRG